MIYSNNLNVLSLVVSYPRNSPHHQTSFPVQVYIMFPRPNNELNLTKNNVDAFEGHVWLID